MKVITYLGFTLLSILIQFCVMDFIQEKLHREGSSLGVNSSSHKKQLSEILKDLQNKPHALFFKVKEKNIEENKQSTSSSSTYTNSTILPPVMTSSLLPPTTTLIDVFYDENSSLIDNSITTEGIFTTTDFENLTDITFFEKNKTSEKPKTEPKKTVSYKKCSCNLMLKVCDINCCCDGDCSDDQIKLFTNCFEENPTKIREKSLFCSETLDSNRRSVSLWADNLFCIAKSNLPEKRNINHEIYSTMNFDKALERSFMWDEKEKPKVRSFDKQEYVSGDPIWLLKNGSVVPFDMPFPFINNYCNTKEPINFLKEENVKCLVSIRDLEMFYVLNITHDTQIISSSSALKSSVMNCSTFHCTNWTILLCENNNCTIYNKTLHEPMCTNQFCTGLALNIEYVFYYFDKKIVNATVKLFTQKVNIQTPYIVQEISTKFYLTIESTDDLVKLSGNPGYLEGHPLIVSYEESNYTQFFYKTVNVSHKIYLPLLANKHGLCDPITGKNILFGYNTRNKCRLILSHLESVDLKNGTDLCNKIQTEIFNMFPVNKKVSISPIGNPQSLKDNDWIPIRNELITDTIRGNMDDRHSQLQCLNIVNRMSLLMTFADVSKVDSQVVNKILQAKVLGTAHNVTFNVEDISLVMTIDINYVDVTKLPTYEYAAGPNLHIHLPRDFFFPFPSNNSVKLTKALYFLFIAAVLVIK